MWALYLFSSQEQLLHFFWLRDQRKELCHDEKFHASFGLAFHLEMKWKKGGKKANFSKAEITVISLSIRLDSSQASFLVYKRLKDMTETMEKISISLYHHHLLSLPLSFCLSLSHLCYHVPIKNGISIECCLISERWTCTKIKDEAFIENVPKSLISAFYSSLIPSKGIFINHNAISIALEFVDIQIKARLLSDFHKFESLIMSASKEIIFITICSLFFV